MGHLRGLLALAPWQLTLRETAVRFGLLYKGQHFDARRRILPFDQELKNAADWAYMMLAAYARRCSAKSKRQPRGI